MKDKKFIISGMVDNVEIPDTDEQDESGENGNGLFRMNINKKDLPDFLRNMRSGGTGKNQVSPEEMKRIAKETGMDEGKIGEMIKQINEMFKSAIDDNFIQKMEKLVGEKGENLSQKEIDREFDKLFSKIKDKRTGEDEELEDIEIELESIVDDRLTGKNFEVLLDPPTLGVVPHQKTSKIMDLFKADFGNGPIYEVGVFSPNIKISNPIKGIAAVSKVEYVEHDDSRIIFRALSEGKNYEPFLVAVIINDNSFEMVVPEYGNTYDVETGLPYDKEKDAALYVDSPKGRVLMSPVDMEKIRAGLELALFEDKKPTLSPGEFGRIIQSKHKATDSGRWIKVGKIQSNESLSAKIFKRDFDIDDEKTMFDFMVRLPEEHSYKVLDALSDYISTVDLNENGRIQSSELKKNGTGELYIDLDLGKLPGNIMKWKDE
jgi:hypothetical protein